MSHITKLLGIFFIILVNFEANASDQAIALHPADRKSLDFYESPSSANPAKTIDVTLITFPLEVHSVKSGFLQLNFENKHYWVKGTHVRLKRESADACALRNNLSRSATSIGSTPSNEDLRCQ